MEKLSVQFLAPHLWQWAVLLLPALALAFWAYYRIAAPLTRPARTALWILRGAAFLLVLLALAQPVITAVLQDTGRPGLAILLDRSASMGLSAGGDSPGATRVQAASEVARALSGKLEGNYRLQWHAFSDILEPANPDSSLRPEGNTGLGQALEQVMTGNEARPVNGIVIVSDGVNTVGRDPVRMAAASPVPIFTVAVGPSEVPQDIEIRRVRTNPTAFVGEPTPVQVVLSSFGLAGRSVRVEVRERHGESDGPGDRAGQARPGDTVLASREVRIVADRGLEQEIQFEIRPSRPGLTLYEVELAGAGDSIPQNDLRQVAIDVLERKTRILVLAPRLDWDFAFLRRTLEADTTLGYTFLAQTRPGVYASYGERRLTRLPSAMSDLRDFAAVILCGVTESAWSPAQLDLFGRFVKEGGGLFALGGPARSVAWTTTGTFASVLPGTVGPDPLPGNRALPLALTGEGQHHPATAVRDNPAETANLWSALPPLWRPGGSLLVKPEAKRLLEYRSSRGGSGLPALAVSFHEQGKTAWLYGTGIWRWSFQPPSGSVPRDIYSQFLLGLVRWLAEPAARERFQVNPSKRVYQNGEAVAFTASLWDAAFNPVGSAQVSLSIEPESAGADTSSSRGIRMELQAGADPGRYDGEGAPLPPGAYRYRAVAREAGSETGSGTEFGRTEGRFWVEEMGPEFARTWTDREQLRQMAERSQGSSADAASIASLLEKIPRALRRVGRISEIEVWNHWLLFLAFVTVLSVEWFLRRRRGLA